MSNRNQVLDIAKGLLIILVVFGHSIQYGFGGAYCDTEQFYDNILFRCIYTFHMPLFMLISGYLFYYTNKKAYREIVKSRLITIGIPLIMYFNIIYIALYNLYHAQHFYFSHYFLALKNIMWFLSSVILNCIIVSSITHFFKDKAMRGYVILWLLLPVIFIIPDNFIPALHKYMYPFFLIGFSQNQYSVKIPHFYWSKWTLGILTLFTIICSFYYDKTIFIYKAGFCVYENGVIDYEKLVINLIRFIVGLGSSCWFVRIIFIIKHHAKIFLPFLIHLGQETLGIYGFQSVFFVVLSAITSTKNINFQIDAMPFLICGLILILCEISIRLCNSNRYTRLLFLGKLSNS